ncbi:MAG: galactitol-1-phosphate 5-dehydrogenase [Clostridiales Family XIII bacterium]|jgi:L-iditol 2-dehydrogenase|nr:galactitol-1-phosphate 5-dehydrogenase [Clostridiales Family XIII bacterium]
MKAWVLRGVGDLGFEDVPAPALKPGEALVRVESAGVCSSDIQRVFAGGAYHYPIILGHEFSGVVEATHDAGDSRWIGRRVGAFPLLPCFECDSCGRGEYETCSDYSYMGSRRDGAFAEYIAVPKWNLVELPANVGFIQGALLEPTAVALHAARQLDFANLGSVAVVGNGTIGNLVARWLKNFGVSDVALIGRADMPARRFDACVEAAGAAGSLGRCVELSRPGGQLVLVGNPAADFMIGQKLYWQILRKQLIIRGSWNSRYRDDWQTAIEAISRRGIAPEGLVARRCGLDELGAEMSNLWGKSVHGKVVASLGAGGGP